ncbi:MAG: hypothetical protein IPK78_17200 [Rhodospirillales bacterium]|nr:hypothetical protein [Rhodospirillales bacterium]
MPDHSDFIRKYKNHRIKLAFYPVLSQLRFAIGGMLENGITFDGFEDILHWRLSAVCTSGQVKLRISDHENKEFIQFNPLALAVSWNDRPDAEVVKELLRDLSHLITDQRHMNVRSFITERAEFRNKLLYAEDAGFKAMGRTWRRSFVTRLAPLCVIFSGV